MIGLRMIEQERKLRTQMLRNAAQPMGRFSELFIFSLSLFIVSGTFLDEITFVSIAYTILSFKSLRKKKVYTL